MKDRKGRTLIPIIERYVKPGSIIFSDKWAGYINLGGKFQHFTVVHKERFVKYHFADDGRTVMKVTTNHIERAWVDVRRSLKGVPVDDVPKRLDEVPIRRLRLADVKHEVNVKSLLEDIRWTLDIQEVNQARPMTAFLPPRG